MHGENDMRALIRARGLEDLYLMQGSCVCVSLDEGKKCSDD